MAHHEFDRAQNSLAAANRVDCIKRRQSALRGAIQELAGHRELGMAQRICTCARQHSRTRFGCSIDRGSGDQT